MALTVTNLKIDVFNWESPPWRVGSGMRFGGARQLSVLSIETDGGLSGHAFLSRPEHHAQALIDVLKPRVIGQNPQDIGRIWADCYAQNRAVSLAAVGAVDIALWDINGKLAKQPIHRLLGTCKDEVPIYSSTAWWETAEEYVEEALKFQADGWTAHKLHPHGDPKADIEICRAVREAVGPEMILMLDSMWSYCYEDAVRVGRAIEELDYYWYEDPLKEEDLYSYVKLHQKLDIPIMSTEFAPGRFYGMTQWITQYATDILRGDVAVTGGITPLLRLCHLAEGFGMKCEIHHGGNSLNNVANLHVTMAVPNCEFFEYFPSTGGFLYGLVEDIDMSGGTVSAPTEPGLGFEIDWPLIERQRLATLT